MKKITKETKSFYDVYVAIDGTEFRSEDECKKYEESAKGVISIRYSKLVVKNTCEYDIANTGSEDNCVDVVRIATDKDVDAILQMFLAVNPHLVNSECGKKSIDRAKMLCERALKEDDILFIGRGYEGDCFWLIGTAKSLKEQIASFESVTDEKKD